MIILSILVIRLIQGEKEPRNLQNDSEIKMGTLNQENKSQEHTENHQQSSETPREIENTPLATQDQWKCTPFN